MKSLIIEHLKNHSSSWSLGAFGALGEFSQDQHEPLLVAPDEQLTIATARGGIRVDQLDQCVPIAYETIRRHRDHWGQAVAFCLPEAVAKMSNRKVITELGADDNSILAEHRQHVIFDLGLATPYVNVCVRTADNDLISALRAVAGTNILAPECSAFRHILHHNPHRIFISRLARLEVYQPIGVDRSPEGPHTHVLPKLLASGLHHAANTPIPQGMISGLMLYPENPCFDLLGNEYAFKKATFDAFQALLTHYGLPDYLHEKERLLTAWQQHIDADSYPEPADRLGRLAARIALRQAFQMHRDCPRLKPWRQRFDRPEKQGPA